MSDTVVVLTTGGTISMQTRAAAGAAPGFDPRRLLSPSDTFVVDLDFRRVLDKGSKDIEPADWETIAHAVSTALAEGARGVVVVHGTDTMHYTAAALSFMVQDLGGPVVLTGSMVPGGDAGSDGADNLRDAVRVAATADLGEVCIVFSADSPRTRSAVLRGNRSRKVESQAVDAFRSINFPDLGTVENGVVALSTDVHRRSDRLAPTVRTDLVGGVVLVKPTPGTTPTTLASAIRGAPGVVIEGTGVGHLKDDLLRVVADHDGPVVMSTQCLLGGERLGLYSSDNLISGLTNVILGGDMTSEAATVKLMWALAGPGDVRQTMLMSVAGERTALVCD
ncbi:MAG: hypothetical protein ABS81_04160 [Pseudonocardia sp. SCN 72-86]|nr:MAG: hypothetical protein ABS81_04160 [Pseudonocardia sp. SCN 72-86]